MTKAGQVQTVLGPVDPAQLGPTQTHEHLLGAGLGPFAQYSPPPEIARTATERARWNADITLENCYDVRWNPLLYRKAMCLDSLDDAIDEARRFRLAGGGTLVELTTNEGGRDPDGLRRISLATGVHVVMGTAYYCHESHPRGLADRAAEDICAEFVGDLTAGVDGVRAGIIGEIGLSWPVHPDEDKVLHAAARAQALTGAPVSIHVGRDRAAPVDTARRLERAGGDPSRTVLCHLDRTLFSLGEFEQAAATGCYLELDLFGHESSFYPPSLAVDLPNDATRIRYLVGLIERGYRDQLLISQDLCLKAHLGKYGGEGYAHILERVVPLMLRRGMTADDVEAILVRNPARLLALARPAGQCDPQLCAPMAADDR